MKNYSDILTKLLHIPGVGSKTAQKVVNESTDQSLRDDEDYISFIIQRKNDLRLSKLSEVTIRDAFHAGEKAIEESAKAGVKTISIFDSNYPQKLKTFKNNPPILLHYKGGFSSLKEYLSCAVIGTREPSGNGFNVGVRVGELLAENNVVVISGLAKGCDTAGHTGCLNKNGKTVAVLAHGLKHLYPKENKKLAESILEKGGALVSEYFYEQTARNNFFVERDRIQAGLSDNIFVVETGVKGGTMHTVKYALENQRKIFTYCHPEKYQSDEKAQGNQMLIKESKATPIANATDFENFLLWMFNHQPSWQTTINPHLNPKTFHLHGSFTIDSILTALGKPDLDEKADFILKKDSSLLISETKSTGKKKPKKVNQILKKIEEEKKDSDDKTKPENDSQMNLWE